MVRFQHPPPHKHFPLGMLAERRHFALRTSLALGRWDAFYLPSPTDIFTFSSSLLGRFAPFGTFSDLRNPCKHGLGTLGRFLLPLSHTNIFQFPVLSWDAFHYSTTPLLRSQPTFFAGTVTSHSGRWGTAQIPSQTKVHTKLFTSFHILPHPST